MILEEITSIKAPASRIFAFFQAMEQNYLDMHPDHKLFRWVNGQSLEVGNVFYFEEVIGGKLLKKRVRLTAVKDNHYIEFEPIMWLMRVFLPKMTWTIEEQNGTSLLIARNHLVIRPLAKRLNRRELAAVRKHMYEEGQNVKKIMEN